MLEARALTKYYNGTPAVRGVSFTIRPGEILGYLGPNGAGKSTTVKMLVGLIEPSEGQIFYCGRSVYEDLPAFEERIGYVPEEPYLYPHLSGREYLQLVGRLRGMPRRVLEPRMDEFLRIFHLESDSHSQLSSYSKGMRQKILLSAALLHNPDILILDEPFSGLDVTSALMLRSLLRALADRGKIILYSSHVLEVVEKVCSNVLILRKGEVAAYDSIEHLRELMRQPSLEGVFAQLAEVDDGDQLAERVLDVMNSHEARPGRARPVDLGLQAYRRIASTLPEEFRNSYGDELLETAEEAVEPVWKQQGIAGIARLLLDVAIRVPIEYLSQFGRDLRYAVRTLRASPGFTVVAMLSLCLGICIAACGYSEMNGYFRDIPGVADPEQLVALQAPASYPAYRQYRELTDVFSQSFAYVAPVPFGVSLNAHTERFWGHLVTSSYFSTLSALPLAGRFFNRADEQSGQTPPVVISYRLWEDRFGRDRSLVGRTLRINGQICTVIGIARKGFRGASPIIFPADLWLPVSVGVLVAPELAENALERPDLSMFQVTGRLQPGVTEARAKIELDAAGQKTAEQFGELDRDRVPQHVELLQAGKLIPVRKKDLPFFREFFLVLGGLILLIACANVANMMLARATGRRREISLRLALGASRSRLITQLLAEAMLLAAGAAVPAYLLCIWLMHLASGMKLPLPMPLEMDLAPDWKAAVFTAVITGLTGLAFGLTPALQATRTDLITALKECGEARPRKYRFLSAGRILVLGQIAASLMLLVLTGYMGIGIQSTLGVQQGFRPSNLYLVAVDPVRDGIAAERAPDFFTKLRDRVRSLPGVTAACLTDTLPVSVDGNPGVRFSDSQSSHARQVETHWARKHLVGSGYFETAGIPILAGRGFEKQGEDGRTVAVIVSRQAVHDFWNGQSPVGRRIEIRNDRSTGGLGIWPGTFDKRSSMIGQETQTFEIVGVAGDVSEDLVASKKHPAVYFPLHAADYIRPSLRGVTLMMRAAPGVDAIREAEGVMAALDSRVTPFDARSMSEHIRQFMSALKGASWTYGLMGAFGLILAAVGVAGLTAYSVTKRTREIGIRMALGARKRNVLALVMKESVVLVACGTTIGLGLAWAGIRALSSIFFTVASVQTYDPVLLVGAPLLLAGLALLGCYLPARRSTAIDPVITLRQD
jgi:predicted permease